MTYLLLLNPAALEKLSEEVRSTFTSEGEINMTSVNQLTYMLACLNEALRMYPPVPTGLPRVVPKNGRNILGKFVPEKVKSDIHSFFVMALTLYSSHLHYIHLQTIVAIHQWSAYHSKQHFTAPFEFHPERFLGDARFENDNFDILQPFHVGPRNCLGRK